VGSNCGLGSEAMVALAREFRRHTQGLLLIQPNAGLPSLVGDVAVYPESPEFMAERARQLLACGVNILGGCCGSTPAHIRALRQTVDRYSGVPT
jgi:5-methyltetrahydrofolate--homocysteine methyltransferase